ncbi:MAG: pentapeptide repeat-containing protein [Nostoc sp. NMS1]|uniref:pentapeptide repeat-containing protein n=1 Tax=unclassified Nostoc TaxID=2593658 RepID=UPI0025D4AEE9|nr:MULTISPECIES: pentapeptide repeat-containing protein [unclassified Nostoc]MBN3907095.1 pentapeptide repeat-containing protein [Nostoc sp. NMS1]MBN3993007.1 pentapeptide repeat-containing protein [Nostoc sp. NMS2]
MANEEHVAILKKGVTTWNKWREQHPEVIPDLSGDLINSWYWKEAEFKGILTNQCSHISDNKCNFLPKKLVNINFENVNLSRADISEVDLKKANLSRANLSGANLNDADLTDTNLTNADVTGALINGAILIRANLSNADLSGAGIVYCDFTESILDGTKFARVKFNVDAIHLPKTDYSPSWKFVFKFNLSKANLSEADLTGYDLSEANLLAVNLKGANLIDANLSHANLTKADLTEANLTRVKALSTDFTSASFTGSCLEDWNINSSTKLDSVICDHIYLRQGQQERRPSNGNFAPREFTKLFQKAQETVDLIFNNGIDWQAFLTSFQKLQVECGGEELSIQAIENKNDGAFVIRVNVPTDANKAEIEKYLKREYEFALAAEKEKYQVQLQGKDEQIEIYRKQSANLNEIIKLLAGKTTYDLRDSQFGGSFINTETLNTDQIGGNIHNNNA